MADSIVTSLIQHLSRLLLDHLNLRSGVKTKITSLCNELEFIDVFLKSSEGKRNHDEVKVVVKQIRNAAHQVEDVVDTYLAGANIQRSRNIVSKILCCTCHEMMLRDVDAAIDDIKKDIDRIYQNRERYGIVRGEYQNGGMVGNASESLRKKRRDVEEENVVGFTHDSSVVINQLKKTSSGRDTVAITGMGGLGKTTLARKVYNDKAVKDLFPHRAWGNVSEDYRPKELFLSILKCLLPRSEYNELFTKRADGVSLSEDEEGMKEKIKETLRGKKYLVVLDDIWKEDVWSDIERAFPDDNKSSRILITTRQNDVASRAATITPFYQLPPLNEKESWTLFSNTVFLRQDCPAGLRELGEELVKRCRGLPLAIKVLAGLAKTAISPRDWLKIKDRVNWHPHEREKEVLEILKLSYDSLPQRLKHCFLYIGIYPEDYEIPVKELIKLWIAEGFIQQKEVVALEVPEPEALAEHYLDELVDRNLLQVASWRSDGGVKTCRIHDFLRDLCIKEGKADKFLEVCTESNIMNISDPRRLSIHCAANSYLSSEKGKQSTGIRSLFFFAEKNKFQKQTLENFTFARVLYFRGILDIQSVPGDLKTMIFLRYLRLDFELRTIPDFIYDLWNLERLYIRRLEVNILSNKLRKLQQLRHVNVKSTVRLSPSMTKKKGKSMGNLQTLSWVDIDPRVASVINNGSFPNLKELGLRYRDEAFPAREQLQCLNRLAKLVTLKISGTTEIPFQASDFPPNLKRVSLASFDKFDSSCISALGRLPNLQTMEIRMQTHAGAKWELDCALGEFPRLLVFQMKRINVASWKLANGAMPRLQSLIIEECRHLNELPGELWSFTDLQHVHVTGPTLALRDSIKNVQLNNGSKPIISGNTLID